MMGTPLRHYRTTGRYYTTTHDRSDIGKLSDEVPFTLYVAPTSDSAQQSLNPGGRLVLRIGAEADEGGYALFSKRETQKFLEKLVNPPEPNDEIVRESVRSHGQFINPLGPSPHLLDITTNTLKRFAVFVEPLYVGDATGIRIAFNSVSIRNTPYVELTPAQYTDLCHTLNEYLSTNPSYREAQSIFPVKVPADGDEAIDLPERPILSEPVQTNVFKNHPYK